MKKPNRTAEALHAYYKGKAFHYVALNGIDDKDYEKAGRNIKEAIGWYVLVLNVYGNIITDESRKDTEEDLTRALELSDICEIHILSDSRDDSLRPIIACCPTHVISGRHLENYL